MKEIIQYTKKHAFDYKTNKSIYNILIGKKTHQTFFDACSQQLLSLYHSLPNLKYPSFERYIHENMIQSNEFITHPRHTYDSLLATFNVIQLLTQTISYYQHQVTSFIPTTQNSEIQKRVKQLYYFIKQNGKIKDFIDEVYTLFHELNQQKSSTYLHYYLQGFEELMYTRQQVSLIENIPQSKLYEEELIELTLLIDEIEKLDKYPILNQTIVLPSLLKKTSGTLNLIRKGRSITEITYIQDVKLNTIEDHILEIFIKGYDHNYNTYIEHHNMETFISFYKLHRGEKLKFYKEHFDNLSYFQIKLLIVGIEREDISVKN